jgi:hypothetical protein
MQPEHKAGSTARQTHRQAHSGERLLTLHKLHVPTCIHHTHGVP